MLKQCIVGLCVLLMTALSGCRHTNTDSQVAAAGGGSGVNNGPVFPISPDAKDILQLGQRDGFGGVYIGKSNWHYTDAVITKIQGTAVYFRIKHLKDDPLTNVKEGVGFIDSGYGHILNCKLVVGNMCHFVGTWVLTNLVIVNSHPAGVTGAHIDSKIGNTYPDHVGDLDPFGKKGVYLGDTLYAFVDASVTEVENDHVGFNFKTRLDQQDVWGNNNADLQTQNLCTQAVGGKCFIRGTLRESDTGLIYMHVFTGDAMPEPNDKYYTAPGI